MSEEEKEASGPTGGLDEPLLASRDAEEAQEIRVGFSAVEVEEEPPAFLEGIKLYLAGLSFLAISIPFYCWATTRQLDHASVHYRLVQATKDRSTNHEYSSTHNEYIRALSVPCQHGILTFQVLPASLSADHDYETSDFEFQYQETAGGPCWLFPEWHHERQTLSKLFVPGVDDQQDWTIPADRSCVSISTVGQSKDDKNNTDVAARSGHYAIVAPGNWVNSMTRQNNDNDDDDGSLMGWLNERVHQWTINGTLGEWCEMS